MSKRKKSAQNTETNSGKRRGRTENILPHRWPKGVSGNPGGRPRKRPVTELYAILGEIKTEQLPKSVRKKLKLIDGLSLHANAALGIFGAAVKGSHGAAKEIREAIEGKSTQRVELTAPGGGPVKLTHEHTIREIKVFYGLIGNDAEDKTPDPALPVPAPVDQRQEPEKDSEKK